MPDKNAVLIVDDDPTTVMLLKHYLEGIGVTALVATDGSSALEVIEVHSDQIALIFLDIAMPHMNGYELCRVIRSNLALADLPVIAVTARSSPEMFVEAEAAGINQIIPKPFKPIVIRNMLAEYNLISSQ
ncbi:MAG: response regulator [Anaerolineae bacterium]|nr:response regulator [Anaerolineae bacterium]